MGLLEDCLQYFGSKNLFEVLGVTKEAKEADVKKSYRRLSLKYHPDRCQDEHKKEEMTKIFQTLSKVHFILSDEEKRSFYETTGLVDKEDCLDSEADWDDYFRNLFPKVTKKDIDSFMEKYIGSEEEREDVKKYYTKFEGDMDIIYEHLIAFDEDRTREIIQEMIEAGEVEPFRAFTHEPKSKRNKRAKKSEKEAKEAKKIKLAESEDLVKAIQSRSKGNFDSMIASLEAKYANGSTNKAKAGKKKKK